MLAALSVFALGVIVGVLLMNLYQARFPERSAGRGWMPFAGFRNLSERLELTDEQSAQVDQILDEARDRLRELRRTSEPQFRDIRVQTEARLKQVLTGDQWNRYEQLKDEMRERERGRRRSRSRDR
jgi:Spy/CpxP family protein refolding chaperone